MFIAKKIRKEMGSLRSLAKKEKVLTRLEIFYHTRAEWFCLNWGSVPYEKYCVAKQQLKQIKIQGTEKYYRQLLDIPDRYNSIFFGQWSHEKEVWMAFHSVCMAKEKERLINGQS